jgi:hypothetical protein
MKQSKERRDAERHSIRVLVNCLPADVPVKRNGHETHGWEMWAKDLGDDGVRLQWSLQWSAGRCPHCIEAQKLSPKQHAREICQSESPAEKLKEGQEIQLDGLVYDEKGSQPMKGTIQWVRSGKDGKVVELGIFVTSPEHRDYFKALEG